MFLSMVRAHMPLIMPRAFLPYMGVQQYLSNITIMSATGNSAVFQTLKIQSVENAGRDQDPLLPKTSFYDERRTSGSNSSASQYTELNLVDFLAIAQWRKIDLLPLTWLPGLGSDQGLIGGTANIQQAPIDLRLSLAYKRIHRENFTIRDMDEIFRLLATEVIVLGHPIIRNHPCIARLEAICWDIQKESIFPVLVFKKAVHGDLRRFMHTANGRNITTENRLRLCSDVASAIMTLHSFRK
jgi:hypothetical protein